MLCEKCRIREANIQYTEVINGVKTEHNFCAQCAREMDFGQYSAIFDGEFPLGKILSGLLDMRAANQEDDKVQQIVCPTCHTSYGEFVKNSQFGCPDCYGVFDLLIEENMKQLQGSDRHKGKRPKRCAQERQQTPETPGPDESQEHSPRQLIRELNRKLKQAIAEEEYETAASCRDQIRQLQSQIDREQEFAAALNAGEAQESTGGSEDGSSQDSPADRDRAGRRQDD